jgi:CBS domain-containing protein
MPLPSDFADLEVDQVMHSGVIDCQPQTPLRELASMMAENSVHCVVIDGVARGPRNLERLVWGVLTDVELMRAAGASELDQDAGKLAASEIVTIEPHEHIQRAAQLMGEHECSHLIVVDPASGRPLGVISSLDVARGLVWGPRPLAADPTT